MDKKILMLSSNNDKEGLEKAVKTISNDEMVSMIEKMISTEDQNFIKLLMALFKGLQSPLTSSPFKSTQATSSSSQAKKTFLFTSCIEILAKKDLSTKLSTDVVRLLVAELDSMPSSFLVKVTKDITEYLKNGQIKSFRFLEILPKLLHVVKTQGNPPPLSVDSDKTEGTDFQTSVVQSVCSIKWNSGSIIHLASIFKEISLSAGELHCVIGRCLAAMDSMDVQEIPPLVYQLLVLSSKGCKGLVLEGIIEFFTKNERNEPGTIIDDIDMIEDSARPESQGSAASSGLRQIEGTVIYHLTFSMKQDREMGKEFLKYLKVYQHCGYKELLSSFVINLALSMSKISSFESQVLDLLKQTVTYCFRDQRKKLESKWLRENGDPPFDAERHVLHSIKQM